MVRLVTDLAAGPIRLAHADVELTRFQRPLVPNRIFAFLAMPIPSKYPGVSLELVRCISAGERTLTAVLLSCPSPPPDLPSSDP